METLLIIWGILTVAFVILIIYRGTLTMHKEDQLFLDDAESHIQKEQQEIQARLTKITPFVNWMGAASGALILVIGAIWLWRGFNQF